MTDKLILGSGKLGESVSAKVKFLKKKNVGFNQLLKIAKLIKFGENISSEGLELYEPNDLACFKYAPVTSCDVERSFSVFKNIFTDKRRSYHFENLKQVVMIQYNM